MRSDTELALAMLKAMGDVTVGKRGATVYDAAAAAAARREILLAMGVSPASVRRAR